MQHKTFYCLVIILSFLIVSVVNAENSSVVKGLARRGLHRRLLKTTNIGQIKVQRCPPSNSVHARKYETAQCSYDSNDEITVYTVCDDNTNNDDNNDFPKLLTLVVALDSADKLYNGKFVIPSSSTNYNYGAGKVESGDFVFIDNIYNCDTDICANSKVLVDCLTAGTDRTRKNYLDIAPLTITNLSPDPNFIASCNSISSTNWAITGSVSGINSNNNCEYLCCARFRQTSTLSPKNVITGLATNTKYYLSFWVRFCGCGNPTNGRCSFTVTIGPTGTGNTYTVTPSTSNGCSNYAQYSFIYNSGSSTTASYTFNVKNTATGGSSGTYIDSIIFAKVTGYDKCKDDLDSCCSGIGNSVCPP